MGERGLQFKIVNFFCILGWRESESSNCTNFSNSNKLCICLFVILSRQYPFWASGLFIDLSIS